MIIEVAACNGTTLDQASYGRILLSTDLWKGLSAAAWTGTASATDDVTATQFPEKNEGARELVDWIETEEGAIPQETRAEVASLDWPD